MKEIYNGETVALGGPNLVTKELVVDDATGERQNSPMTRPRAP